MMRAMKGTMKLIAVMIAVPVACAGLALFLLADKLMEVCGE